MNGPQTAASMNQTKKESHTENRAPSITKWFYRENKERKQEGWRQTRESEPRDTFLTPPEEAVWTGEDHEWCGWRWRLEQKQGRGPFSECDISDNH